MNRTLKPFTPLEQDILTESFKEIQNMLHKIVLSHYQTYGGDLDDLFSEAQETFLLAHMRHDELKSSLNTWIYFIVSHRLQEYCRRETRRLHGCKNVSLENLMVKNYHEHTAFIVPVPLQMEAKEKRKDLEMLLSQVGDDCKNIIYLILFPPQDFEEEASRQKKPSQWKNFIREYLRFNMKWTINRTKKAFNELKRAMEEL